MNLLGAFLLCYSNNCLVLTNTNAVVNQSSLKGRLIKYFGHVSNYSHLPCNQDLSDETDFSPAIITDRGLQRNWRDVIQFLVNNFQLPSQNGFRLRHLFPSQKYILLLHQPDSQN